MKYPSFEYSMLTSRADYSRQWSLIKKSYEQNFLKNIKKSIKYYIPKIIHQIWIGSLLPDKYREFTETWKFFHADWKYILWTDENIKNEKLINQTLYDSISNYGAKSDLLRYELLYKYGGLYVDTDFICLRNFDKLNEKLSFYTGIHDHFNFSLPNGLIATVPGHKIINKLIFSLNRQLLRNHQLENSDELMELIGPGKFTVFVMDYLKNNIHKDNAIVIFPSSYFYPSPASARFRGVDYMLEFNKPESFANHLWEVSWVKTDKKKSFVYIKKLFKKIFNLL